MYLTQKLLLRCIAFCILVSPLSLFWAGPLDHFEVILNQEKAMVWESLDLTVKAVDKDGETITEYDGDILVFSESDPEADFPNELAENSYQFTAADEGEVKFENAVSFRNEWLQDIYVYDLNDENVLWVTEIEITKTEAETNVEIAILSPENSVTLGSNTITISGQTRKNHQIHIVVNDQQELKTTSNSEWVFEKEVENLIEWENTFVASILNADEEIIGSSNPVSVRINSLPPEFKSIKIDPKGEVEAETPISIEVYSTAGLSEATVIINDILTSLEEWQSGVYLATTNAPVEAGKYGVDIILSDEFGNQTKKSDVETLFVTEKVELNSATPEPVEVIEEIVEPTLSSWPDLSITGIKLTELKTKSILTWNPVANVESYNIYKKVSGNQIELVENVTEPRFEIDITGDAVRYDLFAIKAVARAETGEIIQWDLSAMTRVQTGPELYIILMILALLIGWCGMYLTSKRA